MKSAGRLAEVPNSWGESELTKFIDHARFNQFSMFAGHRPEVRGVEAIDDLISKFAGNASSIPGQHFAPMFIVRAHAAFRGAASFAMAGHVAETYPVLRSVLEYAGYSLMLSRSAELEKLWHSRVTDSAAKKKIAQAFSHRRILDEIRKGSTFDADAYSNLYEFCIDFGAHPNTQTIHASAEIKSKGDELVLNLLYLHAGDVAQRNALKMTGRVGLCAARVFQSAFTDRFSASELLQDIDAIVKISPF